MKMKGRDFLTLQDFSCDEIWTLLKKTKALKQEFRKKKANGPVLGGKQVALIFEKPSTRTRVSFEAAVNQLGGGSIPLMWGDLQLGRGETVEDTARVMERYVDALVARVNSHKTLETLAEFASIPVINALSDMYHPCQALSDVFTVWEKFGSLDGLTWSYIGDGNNVCHSLLVACSKLGVDINVSTPSKYSPRKSILYAARASAKNHDSKIRLFRSPEDAAAGADVLYTDVWVSMGMEEEKAQRLKAFKGYTINNRLLKKAKKSAVVMHCLPAHRGVEITDEVIDGNQSIVWDQAENRLHAQKALLSLLL